MPIREFIFKGKISRIENLHVNDLVNDSIKVGDDNQQYSLIEINNGTNKIEAEICGNVPLIAIDLQAQLTEQYSKKTTKNGVYQIVHQVLSFPGEYDKVLIDKIIKTPYKS